MDIGCLGELTGRLANHGERIAKCEESQAWIKKALYFIIVLELGGLGVTITNHLGIW